MRVRGVRRQRAYDRGFVLSDHADWPALLATIAETGAPRILTTHGHAAPQRVVAEATHYLKRKPGSRAFFETMMRIRRRSAPVSSRRSSAITVSGGNRYSSSTLARGCASRTKRRPIEDLYGGRLHELKVPLLVVHGARDPRTEPGELDALRNALPPATQVAILEAGGHSPHSERATADDVTRLVQVFV
jgi:pimeloyl-ACP methyl ester carboxylesterase